MFKEAAVAREYISEAKGEGRVRLQATDVYVCDIW